MGEAPVIRELHLGGGTPTFFSPENLERLVEGLLRRAVIHEDYAFSIEGIRTIRRASIWSGCTGWGSAGSAMACRT
jgi:coproporphyrinogen III oxidase-like Fe-S oxidoreductase